MSVAVALISDPHFKEIREHDSQLQSAIRSYNTPLQSRASCHFD